jgi:hypothetical protein
MTSIFSPNGRRPQFFLQMEDDLNFFFTRKATSIFLLKVRLSNLASSLAYPELGTAQPQLVWIFSSENERDKK